MQAVILCGGQGTRVRDVAGDVPKPMLPIGGRPLLWHLMMGLARHGLCDFVLCLGHQSWAIKRYFLDYQLAAADFTLDLARPQRPILHEGGGEDWRVTFAETGELAMTGCRLKRVERYIGGDDFLLTYGDGLSDVDVTELVAFHRAHGKLGTVTAVRPPGRFGELRLDGTEVVSFREKPKRSRGRVNAGFFVFRREFLDLLDDDPRLVLEEAPLRKLAAAGELQAYRHDGYWQPMDTARDHALLNEMWVAGRAPWHTGSVARLEAVA